MKIVTLHSCLIATHSKIFVFFFTKFWLFSSCFRSSDAIFFFARANSKSCSNEKKVYVESWPSNWFSKQIFKNWLKKEQRISQFFSTCSETQWFKKKERVSNFIFLFFHTIFYFLNYISANVFKEAWNELDSQLGMWQREKRSSSCSLIFRGKDLKEVFSASQHHWWGPKFI